MTSVMQLKKHVTLKVLCNAELTIKVNKVPVALHINEILASSKS